MNRHIVSGMMNTDLSMKFESYLRIRDLCHAMLQQETPKSLTMDEKEIAAFISCAGQEICHLHSVENKFDKDLYNRQIEQFSPFDEEHRNSAYYQLFRGTIDERLVMFFVSLMGMYAGQCDEDDDLWDMYGLGGTYLDMSQDFDYLFHKHCLSHLSNYEITHFDRRLALSLRGVYSMGVSLMGEDNFNWHVKKFFENVLNKEPNYYKQAKLKSQAFAIGEC